MAGREVAPFVLPNPTIPKQAVSTAAGVLAPWNYMIYFDGTNYDAVNGKTGGIDFTGSNAVTVLQSAVNAFPTGNGLITLDNTFAATGQIQVGQPAVSIVSLTAPFNNNAVQQNPFIQQLTCGINGNTVEMRGNLFAGLSLNELDLIAYQQLTNIGFRDIAMRVIGGTGQQGFVFNGNITGGGSNIQYIHFAGTTSLIDNFGGGQDITFEGALQPAGHVDFDDVEYVGSSVSSPETLLVFANGVIADRITFKILDMNWTPTVPGGNNIFVINGGGLQTQLMGIRVDNMYSENHQTNNTFLTINNQTTTGLRFAMDVGFFKLSVTAGNNYNLFNILNTLWSTNDANHVTIKDGFVLGSQGTASIGTAAVLPPNWLPQIVKFPGIVPSTFLATTPSLPSGTGSANAVTNTNPYQVRVFITGGTPSGTHIIDEDSIDKAVSDSLIQDLSIGEKIYWTGTVPSAWLWYGK
jgi:hypothetical protein